MTYEKFKRMHSELIMSVQYLEHDLRILYALVKQGDYYENMDVVDKAAMGTLVYELREADEENDDFKLEDSDYELLCQIRDIRNYWCHQCYLDFHYVEDPEEHDVAFSLVARRLHEDEKKVYDLQVKIEKIRKEAEKQFKAFVEENPELLTQASEEKDAENAE